VKETIAVLGAGSFGIALSRLLAEKGFSVRLWGRNPEEMEHLARERRHRRYLPDVVLPPAVAVTSDLFAALSGADIVLFAVPSQALREVLTAARAFVPGDALLVNVAKGLEVGSNLRLSQVIEEVIPGAARRLAVLSGPSHAEEVAVGKPTSVVAAAYVEDVARRTQELFLTPALRVYTNADVVGVELGGALKNIIAIAAGMSDGLGYGHNARAALVTRGLVEMTRLGQRLGAHPLTFSGLSGLGDLIVTTSSPLSRNWRAGYLLGQGLSLGEVRRTIGQAIEGISTARAARELALRLGVSMPITEALYAVLFEGLDPRTAADQLMGREPKPEVEILPF